LVLVLAKWALEDRKARLKDPYVTLEEDEAFHEDQGKVVVEECKDLVGMDLVEMVLVGMDQGTGDHIKGEEGIEEAWFLEHLRT
jgi:hypothetical protein